MFFILRGLQRDPSIGVVHILNGMAQSSLIYFSLIVGEK